MKTLSCLGSSLFSHVPPVLLRSNNVDNLIMSKLDRIFCSTNFKALFPLAHAMLGHFNYLGLYMLLARCLEKVSFKFENGRSLGQALRTWLLNLCP
jgi:hypothetical protein